MNLRSENGKGRIVLKLFDREFAFYADESSVEICENIRNEAKEMLDNLGEIENDKVLGLVAEFLGNSLEKVIGKENVSALNGYCEMTVSELTAILCYAISEVGMFFADNEERVNGQDNQSL